ncbi:MAG: hypothetical protein ACXACE_02515 [Candidatus Thorarchaeota archaeon]|jgi:tetratricopeptide (TPR) repeat protein
MTVASNEENLIAAKAALARGEKDVAAKLLIKTADSYASARDFLKAAKVYEAAAIALRDISKLEDSFNAFDSSTLMLVRLDDIAHHREIVRINTVAGRVAEDATEYKQAADYYFRASDFAQSPDEKDELQVKAADALENFADIREEEGQLSDAVSLLRKVSRLYYSSGDEELGERVLNRAARIARLWAETAKQEGDFLSAGNALAELAQIWQTSRDTTEAPRLMIEAGELYEDAGLYEKAGNIYDAAKESYKLQRLTSAYKNAMSKASESYLKMEGQAEVLAPLLVKAGDMFTELGRVMKAKWAFKRGNELFAELAKKAASENDHQSEKTYLRYQAMCLKKWGQPEEADALYREVTDYFLQAAVSDAKIGNKEQEAISLIAVAEVFSEMERYDESKGFLKKAQEIYVDLADEKAEQEDVEGSSKFYSRAAECAGKLGDEKAEAKYHRISSEKAEIAAKHYEDLGVPELSTIWIRTAGLEALNANRQKMSNKAISLLRKSATGFRKANELREAFEDLFTVFHTIFTHSSNSHKRISSIIKEMNEIALATNDDIFSAIVSILIAVDKGNHIGALMMIHEHEEDLLPKRDRLRELVELSKSFRTVES